MKKRIPNNNLDIIRVLAAAQVAIVHGVEHIGLRLPFHEVAHAILLCFPGVPIFFIISGFLISASYQRSSSTVEFFKNRALRLFPALWLCFVVTCMLVLLSGYFESRPIPVLGTVIWAVTQLTVFQFYNPEFLREFGVGAVNGSLWTIPVEMQFYVLTPIALWVLMRSRHAFMALFALFAILNIGHNWVPAEWGYTGIIKPLGMVTFLPWFYMFMLGVLANIYWEKIQPLVAGKFAYWLVAYGAVVIAELTIGIGAKNNTILIPWVLMIGGLTLSGAFTRTEMAGRFLRGNDLSYGLYIFHMPVYNFVLEKGWVDGSQLAWLAFALAGLIAGFSWRLVEKPALGFKKYSLRGTN